MLEINKPVDEQTQNANPAPAEQLPAGEIEPTTEETLEAGSETDEAAIDEPEAEV